MLETRTKVSSYRQFFARGIFMEKTFFYWSCVLIFLTADYTNEENEEKMKKKHFVGPVYPLNEINTPKKNWSFFQLPIPKHF